MIVTIVTLYRNSTCGHFVGAIAGAVSPEQRRAIAERFRLGGGDEPDAIGFREVTLAETPAALMLHDCYDNQSEAGYIQGA